MYEPILERLAAEAILFPPATVEEVSSLQDGLKAAQLSGIPQSYGQFLLESNGFAWNGVQFYGTREMVEPADPLTLPSLIQAHQRIADIRPDLAPWQVIGAADDDLYVFDTEKKTAAVLDRSTFEVIEEYRSFGDLFEAVIEEYS